MGKRTSLLGCVSLLFLLVVLSVQSKGLNQTQAVPATVEVSCVPITGNQETPKVKAWVVGAQPSYQYTPCKVDSIGMNFRCHMGPASQGIVIGADDDLGNIKSMNCATFFAPLYLKSKDFPNEPEQFKWPCYCSFVSLKEIGGKLNIVCTVGHFSEGVMTVYVDKKPHQGPVHCPKLTK